MQNKRKNIARSQNKLRNQSFLVPYGLNPNLSRFAEVRLVTGSRNRNNQDSPSLSQNTEHSPPLLVPTPLPLAVVLGREGRTTPALKVSQAFIGSLGLHDDRSIPPWIDVPSARYKVEGDPLPIWRRTDLECRTMHPPNDIVIGSLRSVE